MILQDTARAPQHRRPATTPRDRLTTYLEYASDVAGYTHKIPLTVFPFCVGRADTADFVVPCPQISREHATIYRTDSGETRVRDLGSTNGTFINGCRIQDAELTNGDILNLAHREFRFVMVLEEEEREGGPTTHHAIGKLPLSVLHARPVLEELIRGRFVKVLFQPIVDQQTRRIVGYEALGRGTHEKLSPNPTDLFHLADRCGLVGELSRLFREVAAQEAQRLPRHAAVFLNIHPKEIGEPELLESLRAARESCHQTQTLVVEIHEDTVAEMEPLQQLRRDLQQMGVLLAYDDFGAGQARIAELTEVPPDFLKLNINLIRDIHLSQPRQRLLRTINRVARDLGVRIIAEGIESEDEARICKELGCELGQGYLFGHPSPAPTGDVEPETWELEFLSANGNTHLVEMP
jgi:EAL domain-containing protein (putative c-di-GMP-specific phosphodiesterase class I)